MAPRRFGSGLCGLLVPLPMLLLLLVPWPAAGHGGKYSRERNEPERPPKREPGGEFRMEKLNQLWEKAQRVRLFPARSLQRGCPGAGPGVRFLPWCADAMVGVRGALRRPGDSRPVGRDRGAACAAASRRRISPCCEVARFLFGRRARKSRRRDREARATSAQPCGLVVSWGVARPRSSGAGRCPWRCGGWARPGGRGES